MIHPGNLWDDLSDWHNESGEHVGHIAAAGISFVVGLIVVTGLELGVGKSLSCWVCDECSTEESSCRR
jgi:hypothetical protein